MGLLYRVDRNASERCERSRPKTPTKTYNKETKDEPGELQSHCTLSTM